MIAEALVAVGHVALLAYAPPIHWEVWATFLAFVAVVQVASQVAPGRLVVGVAYSSGRQSKHRANGVGVEVASVAVFSVAAYVGVLPANIVHTHWLEFLSVASLTTLGVCLLTTKVKDKRRREKERVRGGEKEERERESSAVAIEGEKEERRESAEEESLLSRILCGQRATQLVLPFGLPFDGLQQLRTGHVGLLLASLSIAAEQYDREVVRGLLQVQQLIFGVPLLLFLLFVVVYVTDRLLFETQETSSVTWYTERRTGLLRLWLTFVAIPFLCSSPAWWLIGDPRETLWPPLALAAVLLFAAGYTFFRGSTAQKHLFRTRGPAASVWGERPLVIEAVHQPGDLADGTPLLPGMGSRRVLLVCGYWSLVRHPRALGILLMLSAAALLCAPSPAPWLLPSAFAAYMLLYLSRCMEPLFEAQYGPVWRRYCTLTPRMLFPKLF